MKIIKRGEIEKRVWTVTCWQCKSVLEYDSSDIKTNRNESYVLCPVCSHFIDSSTGVLNQK